MTVVKPEVKKRTAPQLRKDIEALERKYSVAVEVYDEKLRVMQIDLDDAKTLIDLQREIIDIHQIIDKTHKETVKLVRSNGLASMDLFRMRILSLSPWKRMGYKAINALYHDRVDKDSKEEKAIEEAVTTP